MRRQLLDSLLPPAGASKATPKAMTKPAAGVAPRLEKPKSIPIPKRTSSSVAPASNKSSGPSIVVQALTIVAEEIGVAVSELSNDSTFADFGVDSLLSLTISGRFWEELDTDVESSIFIECPTVKDLKGFLLQNVPGGDGSQDSADVITSQSSSTGSSTSKTECDVSFSDDESATSVEEEEMDPMNTIRLTLAEEIGVSLEELAGSSNLAELGMDSLMSLTVLGKLREALSMELPSDLFVGNKILDAIGAALGIKAKPTCDPCRPEKAPSPMERKPASKPAPPTTSILLQGNPKTASRKLFLFPDGSGSSTSYASLPRIASDVAVYGLNCPYMKMPENLKCSLEGLTFALSHRGPSPPANWSLLSWRLVRWWSLCAPQRR